MNCNCKNRLNCTQLFSKLFFVLVVCSSFVTVPIYWVVMNQNSVCGTIFVTGCIIRRVLKALLPPPKKRILFMPFFHSFRLSLSHPSPSPAWIWLSRDRFTWTFILGFLPTICWHSHFWLISDTNTRNRLLLTKNHAGGHTGIKTRLRQHDFCENRRNENI
jgi:hypothetical protein